MFGYTINRILFPIKAMLIVRNIGIKYLLNLVVTPAFTKEIQGIAKFVLFIFY